MFKKDNRLDSVLNKIDIVLEKQTEMHIDVELIKADLTSTKSTSDDHEQRIKTVERPFNFIKTSITVLILAGTLAGAIYSIDRVIPGPVKAETHKTKVID